MQLVRSRAATNLAVRLVAVNSGVILNAALYPGAHRRSSAVGQDRFQTPGFPVSKLEVPRDRALPVSLLNLRAAVGTTASAQTERLLSALLFSFDWHGNGNSSFWNAVKWVLCSREKNIPGPDDAPFWNSGYLLEGIIDRDGAKPELITIHAQLVPPSRGAPVSIEISGARSEPTAVVEQLALSILKALRREPTTGSWNAQAEADRFEQEAVGRYAGGCGRKRGRRLNRLGHWAGRPKRWQA